MKTSNWLRMGCLVASLCVAAPMLVAQAGSAFDAPRPQMKRVMEQREGRGRWWKNPEIATKIGLSDAQRKQMDGILDQHRLQLVDLRGNVEKAKLTLEPLMKADQPDEGKIIAQIDQVAQAKAALQKADVRFMLAIRSTLTADQWKQLQALRAEHNEHRGFGGQDGRGNWGGPHEHDGNWNGPHGQMPPPPPPGQQGMFTDGPDGQNLAQLDGPNE